MNQERWQRVKQLLEEAITLDASERSLFLDRECNGDADVRQEVDSLLCSHEQAGTAFLKKPAADLKAALAPSGHAGRRIGVYQIVEEIGHGGMGEVYRAIRADGQYTKEVAVKVVRGGFDSKSVQERFRNERQILASLDHPNIARLLDGGTTDDGVAYLVMELIEGIRIDSYCDEQGLSISGRLELFRQVCGAVQFAHQRLVIHRDIKPSNILVTREGVPKLLDFGIAKILDPAGGGVETTMARPMTPEYASPEQIRGEAITTASDVYSLGVVLYRLLTGQSPYSGDTRSSLELARAVCETDPGRPSSVVMKPQPRRSELAEHSTDEQITPEQISRMREGSLAKLRRRLAGDVDNIVLKALRKEPKNRYASAEQLAQDIERHRQRLPVTATRGSWRYYAGKFVTRNKAGVVATGAVTVALVAGVGGTVREAQVARHHAETANAERARAERRFNDVRKLANSLIFEIHDSIQELPGATPARKLLLDRAVEYLDKLSQDASGDVDLQRELAWGYQRLSAVQGDTSQSNLGQISAAEASVAKSISLFEAVAKANPKNVTDQLNLAMAYRRRAFSDVYEPTGLREIDQALAVSEPLTHAEQPAVEVRYEWSLELQILAAIQDAMGDRLKAIDTFRHYVDVRQDIARTNPDYKGIRRSIAHSTVELGYQLGRFGDRAEAVQLLNHGITRFEALVKEGGNQDVVRDLAASEVRRGQVQLMGGDPKTALADFQRAAAATARLAKRDPQNTMLQSDMCGLDFDEGRALTVSGKPVEGLAHAQKALECYVGLHLEADTGPGIGAMESWIAEGYAGTHDFPAALKHYQAAAKALTTDLGKYDDARCDLAMVETKIGNTFMTMGELSGASEAYAKALDTAKLPSSLEHMDIPALYAAADAYAGMAEVASRKARETADPIAQLKLVENARQSYRESLNVWKQIPYPSPISGNGYIVGNPKDVMARLDKLRLQ